MTLNKAIVNLGNREVQGLTYVALSRTKRVEDLLIDYE